MTELTAFRSREDALAAHIAATPPGVWLREMDGGPEETLLRHYLRIFYRNRWIIGAITAASLALAIVASMLMQRQYTATVRVQIAREAAKVVDVEDVQADQGEHTTGPEFYQTQYALLRSRSLSEAVVRDLRLTDKYAFLANFNPARADEYKAVPRADRFERAVRIVNHNTKIMPVPGSGIVDVGYESADPKLSAAVANSIAENFIQTSLTRRYDATTYARNFLEGRINAVRAKLEESERKAAAYAQAQGIIKISGQGEGRISSEQTLASADLAQLSSQLATARAARVQAESDYRANGGGAAAASALSNTAVNQLRGQRAQLSSELSKLQSDYGPEYPKVAALGSQIAELDRQIGGEQGRVTSSVAHELRDKYRQALANEQGLQARVNGLKSAVLNQDQRAIQFNIIQRDVDTNRSLYDALLQRFKEVGVTEGVGTNNVSIVDKALPPRNPSQPNVPLNLALGLLVGLMLGGGTALVREQLADGVILPSEFQQKLGVKLLGTTPKFTGEEVLRQLADRESQLSEAYFSILTAIQFSSSHATSSSMLFTSTQSNEGKSTTALTIARNLARVGARVLLIDADMRNPSLHRHLGMANSNGLSDLLTGRVQLAETVHVIGSSTLSVMFAGRRAVNPAELLSTSAIDDVLSAAGEHFDHVLIDGPPVLGLADAVLLSRAAEATVFVIEANRTRASQARLAISRLRAVGADILGSVLTKLDAKEAGYGDSYAYQYNYAHRSEPRLLTRYLKKRQ
jgi:polysaccharide biosynthesis transport protein